MAKLNRVLGTYAQQQMYQPLGFQLGASNSVLRDGTNVTTASGKMFTVTRVSAGLYTIGLLAARGAWPTLPFILPVVEQAAAPTVPISVHYVKGSYSASARTFQVQVMTIGTTPAASDGDATDRVTIFFLGGIGSTGVDPA